ncbi:Gfo/Idh/MocA family protein [Pelagicoccus mobilis]|uniref:Gfo/Idh/MocA family oxidoreductase n=1 Tax=Pelagicoccus mobilis TaxID=415221 RepID=A0A934RVK0_9BACT|nr:Gfo/Idh/MocA family oxidoreductase [Pelagicoccus mobilis]MBK1878500.1 Gfo/Idh/MocA family oxidoreductase [Pelagicoccus mobilis]
MSEIRFGFIGTGKIAYSSAEELLSHENASLVAAQDLSAKRLGEFADKFAVEERYANADDLFASPNVDAVYIAVPNKYHAPLAIAALKAGKHVMLEKPFAMNATEAEAVVSAAKESGKLFTLGMNQRFREDSQKIRNLATAGKLGEIYYAKAYWFRRSGIPTLGTWFGNKELAGAGAINDIGVHLLDLCLHTIDNFDPVSVSGRTYTKFGNRGLGGGGWGISDKSDAPFDVDDFATALIKMRNGATISLEVSWACHTEKNDKMDVEVFGTEAGASLYPARLYKSDTSTGEYQIVEDVNAPVSMKHSSRFHNFTNAILGTEELAVPAEQALVIQKILDAIAESSSTGKEVTLS